MRVTYDVNKNTVIQYKLVPPSDDGLNIKYRAWLEISNRGYDNGRSFVEGNDIWFYDKESLDNMILVLLNLQQKINDEKEAIQNHIDAIESTAKVC